MGLLSFMSVFVLTHAGIFGYAPTYEVHTSRDLDTDRISGGGLCLI